MAIEGRNDAARDPELGSGLLAEPAADAFLSGPKVAASGPVPLPAGLARADEAPFVGRRAALGQLQDRWRDDAPAAAGLVVVTGEPGIGKRRLVARFAAGVHAEGGIVLCGRADEESVWPYQAFVEALRHYAAHRPGVVSAAQVPPAAADALAALVPELATPEHPGRADKRDGNRHQLVEAVVRLLLHAAQPAGLLLVLEDLHWADAPTTLLLRHVLRRAEGSRLLVVATVDGRDAAGSAALEDLGREAQVETIALTGLDPGEAAELIAARGHQLADEESDRLCDETGGNPLFIEELLRSPSPRGASRARACRSPSSASSASAWISCRATRWRR